MRLDACGGQCGDEFNLVFTALEDSDIMQRIFRRFEYFDKEIADLVTGLGINGHMHLISRLSRLLADRDTIDEIDERAQKRIAGEDEKGQQKSLGAMVDAGKAADRGRAPQCRRRIENCT